MSQQSNNQATNTQSDIQFTELTIPEGSSLKLSVLEQEPKELTAALSEFFKQHKVIRRGFIVSVQEIEKKQYDDILMIALEFVSGTENIDEIIHQAGSIACEYIDDDESIDFCIVNDEETGISHFITKHVAPFYQRRLGSFLRDTIPIVNM
ncbi:enhanced serine sensitivity protein SseB [Providencia rustigianii]|uniref:Enhanced serine sensitivity protein SseB n=1 Tax=Providencia rustigianii TaxID=158850 RepID=A0A379G5D6_9GAMM|nr:enhanced serine sensitivity protein SseB C-terminal domain-containing protein [Providencia rustigianii]SUC36116.1 enhanced serine sensitivity protein SseB [Providencia rustigianii]